METETIKTRIINFYIAGETEHLHLLSTTVISGEFFVVVVSEAAN